MNAETMFAILKYEKREFIYCGRKIIDYVYEPGPYESVIRFDENKVECSCVEYEPLALNWLTVRAILAQMEEMGWGENDDAQI